MKSYLTDNGVLTLYNQIPCPNVKVQVLYAARVNSTTFLRVTDSKNLSPVIIILRLIESIIVGDIILVKKVQVQGAGTVRDSECLHLMDSDLNFLHLIDYQVMESRNNVEVLYHPPNGATGDAYWNSIYLLKNFLMKGDVMAENNFTDVENRMKLLRPDCNLLRERGNALFKRKQYDKAIIHYDMAKQKDHYDSRIWNNSSFAYYGNEDYEKAQKDALVAMKLDPFNTKGYYRAGQAISASGDNISALEIIETGLYVCEKCEDLERLLQTVKDEMNKKDVLTNSSAKKEISNTINSLAYSADVHSKQNGNFIGNKRNSKQQRDSPVRKPNKENRDISAVDVKGDHYGLNLDTKSDGTFLSLILGAKALFEKNQHTNALRLLEVIMKNNRTILFDRKEEEILKYLVAVCKINSRNDVIESAKSIESARSTLLNIVNKEFFPFPPAVHYWLAITFELLDNQEKVIFHANACGQQLKKKNTKYSLFWPETQDHIKGTHPEELTKWFMEGSWRTTRPIAKCRHNNCISVQGHRLANQEIFVSDMDFRGYIEVECEEFCSIVYHWCCWKAIKDSKEEALSNKKTDKDFIELQCFTPDCSGKICSIRTFDENCELKNETAKDRKEKKVLINIKLKKKKEKKKNFYQKFDDKKKIEVKIEDEIEIVSEETALPQKLFSRKSTATSAEPINFEGSDYKVLKPDEDEDNNEFLATKSKKKKKKKTKQISHISIIPDEVVDDRDIHNDYLVRLKALKAQREVMEAGTVQSTNHWSKGLKFLPECVLDPEKPFYLPQHLQDNPAELERVLRNKMVTASSSDMEPEGINSIFEFMHDFLKSQKPMNINDARIRDHIKEYFPPEAVAYVNKCGDIKKFLLQSFRFAIIDDIICVNEHVVAAQNMAIQGLLDKFKSPKYLISDGHRAVKYSHLLDDTKSSCSTNSSQSNNIFAASSSDSYPSLTRIDHSASATPYKSAAMAQPINKKNEIGQDILNIFNKPKPIPPPSIDSKKIDATKKSKLKTMDIDDFEEIGKLFASKSTQSIEEKSVSVTSEAALAEVFHSDDESSSSALPSKNEPTAYELQETIKSLQVELNVKSEEIMKMSHEKEMITAQNEHLNDKISQMKSKFTVEISALKKKTEDANESTKIAETNLDVVKSQIGQKDHELKKLVTEKGRLIDEIKSHSQKKGALELAIDQLKNDKTIRDDEIQQLNICIAEKQQNMMNFQEAASKFNDIARQAEIKYMGMKKEMILMNLEKTKSRMNVELNVVRELLQKASEGTQPSKSQVLKFVHDYEDTLSKIDNSLQATREDGERYLGHLNGGRHLNTLPPGDLQVPTVKDLTLAHLLSVRNPSLMKPNKPLIGANMFHREVKTPLANSSLPLGRAFSFGQLGMATQRGNNNPPIGIRPSMDSMGGKVPPRFNSDAFDPSMKMHRMNEPFPKFGEGLNQMMDGISSCGPRMSEPSPRLFNDRMNETSPRFGGKIDPSLMRNKLSDSSVFLNGGASAATSSFREELGKLGSSASSSPISGSPAMTFTAPDHSNAFGKPNFEQNNLFVGQLPWNFTENNLKNMFSKFGEVVSAVIHNRNQSVEGKPVPKCGFVSFRTLQQRDYAIRAGKANFPHLNIQAKEMKHPANKMNPISSAQSMDLPLRPMRSSAPNPMMQHNKLPSSAFGLQSLVNASKNVVTAVTPTNPTTTKPKFEQSVPGPINHTVGTIGGPKVVRPTPRSVPSSMLGLGGITNPSYKRLLEECKLKFGTEYPESNIDKAIRSVRERNNNSLSGLAKDTILSLIEGQLRLQKPPLPNKPSVAPWADMAQHDDPGDQWTGLGNIAEEECSICYEKLNLTKTTPLECGHMFHTKCIDKWLKTCSNCPICRKFACNKADFPTL